MLKLKEVVIVEGKYDKIKLSGIIDAPIIETNGFRIFKDKEKQSLIRKVANKRGILIITDSDSAGFVIRNFLKGIIPEKNIKQCYIPQLKGKEKRKEKPSKEGLLGVEGVDNNVIVKAVRSSDATIIGEEQKKSNQGEITKSDLFDLGLTGTTNSKVNREKLLKHLNLPAYLSTNAMLTALNILLTKGELQEILCKI
jgi:ribonuclease M5